MTCSKAMPTSDLSSINVSRLWIGEGPIRGRIGHRTSVCLQLISFGISIALCVGACAACTEQTVWGGNLQARILPLAGLAYSLTWLVLCIWPQTTLASEFQDGLLALAVLVGSLLVCVSVSTGLKFCPLCIIFWGCQVGMASVAIWSEKRMAKLIIWSICAGAFACTAIGLSPASQLEIRAILPEIGSATGPLVGTKLIPLSVVIPDGWVVIETRCAPCARAAASRALSLFSSNKISPLVLLPEFSPDIKATVKGERLIEISKKDYESLNLRMDGPPRIICVQGGIVNHSYAASDLNQRSLNK